eukprot:gene61466-biopygen3389
MKSFTETLDSEIVKLLADLERNRTFMVLTSAVKICCFTLAVIVIIPGCSVFMFFSILRKVFFNLLIGWKGLNLGSMAVMFVKFISFVAMLTGPLHIPLSLIQILFYPLGLICKLADLFNVDGLYTSLTVTCQGAKAPIELFVDSSVLGAAILFIKSNYIFLWAITFNEMNKLSLVKFWVGRKNIFSVNFAVMVLLFLLSSANPFISALR